MSDGTNLDAQAVDHILNRLQRDPRLAYLMGPFTESFDLLTQARATRDGVVLGDFIESFTATLKFQSVPRIGDCDAKEAA